jgi:hypothetical protein
MTENWTFLHHFYPRYGPLGNFFFQLETIFFPTLTQLPMAVLKIKKSKKN